MKKLLLIPALLLALGLALSACGRHNAATAERNTAANQLKGFEVAQPIPTFNYSQLRQNLIELETAQAKTTQTTSFFFNQGVQNPIEVCPSIGFPIAADTQLTNPLQEYYGTAIGLIDPTGVYTGQTSGTYVICVNAAGKAYANYWEGFVQTVTGAASWDYATHSVTPVNNPTAQFSTHQ